jgi:hypothetical protein
MRDTNGITNNPVPATPSKKVAAQFSKAAKVKALTTLLREAYGGSFTRKDLKEFEKKNNVVVQWIARREDPVQNFRTPLGFVRSGRATFAIPVDSNPIAGVAARTADAVKTVTDVPGGPGRDVVEVAGQPVTVEAGEFPTSGADV